MSAITFVVEDECVTEIECKVEGARLAYRADGLLIYIDGAVKHQHPDCIPNMAMNACLLRHIPLLTLRAVKPQSAPKSFDTDTRRMF